MKKSTADFSCQVWADCPHCDGYQNITEQVEEAVSDTSIPYTIVEYDGEIDDGEGDAGVTITCKECGKDFCVEKIEY